jgi:hypothetical protein
MTDLAGAFPILEIIIGSGVVAMLWQMNRQIGSLTTAIESFHGIIEDHEDRLRNLEKGK